MGEREIVYLSLHHHHQNDFCIKMGSDESHFMFIILIMIDSFYIALFSALEQTQCAHVACDSE